MPEFQLPSLSAAEALSISDSAVQLIDVRKPCAVTASSMILTGARYHDPFDLSQDAVILKTDVELVFYCVHGHEVSQYATALAMLMGSQARYVVGGFEALVAAGATLEPYAEGQHRVRP